MRRHHIVAGFLVVGFSVGLPVLAQEHVDHGDTNITSTQGKGLDYGVKETNSWIGAATGESTLYVDANAPVGGDGSSWATAFVYLQDALAAASESGGAITEIWVARGNYGPDQGTKQTPGDRSATFRLINGLVIRGGYAGFGSPDPDEVDLSAYETILSGDLNSDDGPAPPGKDSDCCIIYDSPGCSDDQCKERVCDVDPNCCDYPWGGFCGTLAAGLCCELCSDMNNCDNSYHVVTGSGVDATAVLDGFTITAGNANFPTTPRFGDLDPNGLGGGMYVAEGSPTVMRCTFTDNEALGGGGMSTGTLRPSLTNCSFRGNRANTGGGMFSGGATILRDCRFVANTAVYGGGIYGRGGDSFLTNCLFAGNSSLGYGGGILGGFYRATLNNCVFTGNTAGSSWPGGIYDYSGILTLTNCTFSGNSSGGVFEKAGKLSLTNCIFWGNTVYGLAEHDAGVKVSYTCSQDSWWASHGIGNIGDDPLFVDADGKDNIPGTEDDDLRLLPTSPAIDAGDNTAVTTSTDLAGNPRINDGTVDMGAYEGGCLYNSACNDRNVCTFDRYDCLADTCSNTLAEYCDVVGIGHSCGPDGEVDLLDILAVLDAFQGVFPRDCHPANMDIASHTPCVQDGTIDLHDILAFLDAFRGTGDCACDP